jgi:micrococcal nuclease
MAIALMLAVGSLLPLPFGPYSKPTSDHRNAIFGLSAQAFEADRGNDPLTATHSDTVHLRRGEFTGPFEADIVRIVDGDTIEARVRIWFGQDITTLVRIRGIDAPELHARCSQEAKGAQAARDYLIALAKEKTAILRNVSLDKYGGRVLAHVTFANAQSTTDITSAMLEQGLARPYQGGKRQSWCES